MNLDKVVQAAAKKKGIIGVMEMTKHCGLSYQRTARVWDGETNGKVIDVITVLDSLGLCLVIEKVKK